jgi:hypothetical protein
LGGLGQPFGVFLCNPQLNELLREDSLVDCRRRDVRGRVLIAQEDNVMTSNRFGFPAQLTLGWYKEQQM